MPSLKDLRSRISSVKSTKKITSAMKMVAAAKLKKAQENAVSARPYSQRMQKIIKSLYEKSINSETGTPLIKGTGSQKKVLLIVCSADKGLCGGFNSSIIRFTKNLSEKMRTQGKDLKYIFIGKKASNAFKNLVKDDIIKIHTDIANPMVDFKTVIQIRDFILDLFDKNSFDVCDLIYTEFKSAISQEVKKTQIIPFKPNIEEKLEEKKQIDEVIYEFEPSEEDILKSIIPQNIAIQIFTGLLESTASEQGARMTAMDNATRNANDKIDDLTMFYNRSRQAVITKELIEIISGAEAI